jgi:predicted GNAT family acetyltransferase
VRREGANDLGEVDDDTENRARHRQPTPDAVGSTRRPAVKAPTVSPAPPKLQMRCELPVSAGPVPVGIRPMRRDDLDALGTLFYTAYRGTVDDEGESPEEARGVVQAAFDGEFGPFVPDASMVVESGGALLSAAFVTEWQGLPLLAFTVTRPESKGQGHARRCTAASMQALAAAGHRELRLFVTETNVPARVVYERLGFVLVNDA